MSPRPRNPGSRDLPANLYKEGSRFRYRRPSDGRWFRMGTDRAAAVAAARELNAIYLSGSGIVERVLGVDRVTFAVWLPAFETHLGERDLSPVTLADYNRKLIHIRTHFAAESVADVDVRSVAEFLAKHPPTMANRYRALLSVLFRFAMAEGLRSDNPAAATMPRRAKVKRSRLTLNQWNAIYADADVPGKNAELFRRALVLALQTLQRRDDLACLLFADIHSGAWHCVQAKTGARVRIELSPYLLTVISQCRDRVASHCVLHYPFETGRRYRGKGVTPDWLTKAFARVRDACECFNALPPEARPSFHEIRALGADLYRQAGHDERAIQALLGHATLAMTEGYLSRHERPFVDAVAGLVV